MSKNLESMAERIHGPPLGRSEAEWLDALYYLVSRLEEATSAPIQVGKYWVSECKHDASVCAQVRSKASVCGINSDCWEAVVCLSGNEKNAWSDVYAFPYLNDSAVTQRGRIADLGQNAEVDEFRWFQLKEGRFNDLRWGYPDGPGEWARVQEPGDVYQQNIECVPVSSANEHGSPLAVDVTVSEDLADTIWGHLRTGRHRARFSLIHVNRNRERTNLAPWTAKPPSRQAAPISILWTCPLSRF